MATGDTTWIGGGYGREPRLIPSTAGAERSARTAYVEHGKVWVALGAVLAPGCLRDVPAPRETVPACEGPLVWTSRGASEPREEMPAASSVSISE